MFQFTVSSMQLSDHQVANPRSYVLQNLVATPSILGLIKIDVVSSSSSLLPHTLNMVSQRLAYPLLLWHDQLDCVYITHWRGQKSQVNNVGEYLFTLTLVLDKYTTQKIIVKNFKERVWKCIEIITIKFSLLPRLFKFIKIAEKKNLDSTVCTCAN